ncbi:MAG: PBP1A family penicillin-binding protein [Vulcanimicrobiaceae bacterium]
MADTIATRRKKRRRLSVFGRIVYGTIATIFLVALFAAGTVAGVVYSYSKNLPDINRMADFQPSRSTRVYARNGELLATLYKQNRLFVPIGKIPQRVRNAFIANEDHNFYKHHGVDFAGIARAAIADYRHERFQGASTITQQLARALFLSNERSISRKIQEALLAFEIERYYTKDEILERYLNLIYFGAGAYGIEAAAHTYFGTGVAHLTIAQAAMLAGLPAAPSDYSPYVNRKHAIERQHHVLERMQASGYISQPQLAAALDAPLGLVRERLTGLQSFRFPYFTTYVTHVLDANFGTQAVYEGGLEVNTTLDPRLQRLAQNAVDWGVGRAVNEGINAHQAALVAIRPQTGEIVAMVGGAGGFTLKNQFNRAWQALRQPGSSFKPYVYTAAIDSGMPPTSIVDDSPVSYPMGDGTQWHPMDDDFRFLGGVTLRYALAQSRNVVAVKLAQQVGVDRVIEYAHRMGVRAPLEANLSLALGSSVVTPLDQAAGFATLANQGIHIDPSPLRLVRDSIGTDLIDNRVPQETEVVSAGTAYLMSSMLAGVIKEGTGNPNADIGRPAAGKTGTTSDFRDAWFVGFTPDLVVAVWLGNDDYSRMRESYGGNIPARTWARFMRAALARVPKHEFVFPSTEVRKVAYCGQPKKFEYFLDGTEPLGSCASAGYYGRRRAQIDGPPVASEPIAALGPVPREARPSTDPRSVARAAGPAGVARTPSPGTETVQAIGRSGAEPARAAATRPPRHVANASLEAAPVGTPVPDATAPPIDEPTAAPQ